MIKAALARAADEIGQAANGKLEVVGLRLTWRSGGRLELEAIEYRFKNRAVSSDLRVAHNTGKRWG